MPRPSKKSKRDIEKAYPSKRFVEKLRRLADCIEEGKRFRIQIAGERVSVPADAIINIEHERGSDEEEIEFQLKWSNS
ncbi:amphi-Trp domain-containing protein [Candidatus Hydrogenedentota bacterium]